MKTIQKPSQEELENLISATRAWLGSETGRHELQRSAKRADNRIDELQRTEQIGPETLRLVVNL